MTAITDQAIRFGIREFHYTSLELAHELLREIGSQTCKGLWWDGESWQWEIGLLQDVERGKGDFITCVMELAKRCEP